MVCPFAEAAPRVTFLVRRLSIAEILDEGFRLFRRGFGRLVVFQLIVYVPTTALLAFGIAGTGDIVTEMASERAAPELAPLALKLILFITLLIGLQAVVGAFVMVATSRAVADSYLGNPWTAKTVLSAGLRLAPRSTALGAFLTLVFFAGLLGPAAVAGAGGIAVLSAAGGGAAAIAVAALFALAVAAMSVGLSMLLILRYGLSLSVLALEGATVRESIARSVELMRGRYLRGLALFGILIAVNLLITSILSAFVPMPSFRGIDPDEFRRLLPQFIRGQVLSTILGQISSVFVQIYTSICWTLFYFTARCELEAFDLSYLADRFGRE